MPSSREHENQREGLAGVKQALEQPWESHCRQGACKWRSGQQRKHAEAPTGGQENVSAGRVALSLGKARCSNMRGANGMGQRQERGQGATQLKNLLASGHHFQMRPCWICPQSCQPPSRAPPPPPRKSASAQGYLLQVLRAALILVHVQVHKADLGERAGTVSEATRRAVLSEESKNQGRMTRGSYAFCVGDPASKGISPWGFYGDLPHPSHNCHWFSKHPPSATAPRTKLTLC